MKARRVEPASCRAACPFQNAPPSKTKPICRGVRITGRGGLGPMRRLCFSAVLVAAILLAGCVSSPRSTAKRTGSAAKSKQVASHDSGNYWKGDDATGPARVKIDLGEQRAYLF